MSPVLVERLKRKYYGTSCVMIQQYGNLGKFNDRQTVHSGKGKTKRTGFKWPKGGVGGALDYLHVGRSEIIKVKPSDRPSALGFTRARNIVNGSVLRWWRSGRVDKETISHLTTTGEPAGGRELYRVVLVFVGQIRAVLKARVSGWISHFH